VKNENATVVVVVVVEEGGIVVVEVVVLVGVAVVVDVVVDVLEVVVLVVDGVQVPTYVRIPAGDILADLAQIVDVVATDSFIKTVPSQSV
jgi:hypothetical protein